ncbi:unnamed protein product [Lactuca virosa]|uniref:Uncharacterized protein n=1 Tax=Lactuca virosa TaxID=75947 RepID=A0AAU9NZH9_9ASTR|nr:unnamed protein product [Lactuca virosa]
MYIIFLYAIYVRGLYRSCLYKSCNKEGNVDAWCHQIIRKPLGRGKSGHIYVQKKLGCAPQLNFQFRSRILEARCSFVLRISRYV